MHCCARIADLAAPLAPRDLVAQVGQRDVGAELRDQILLAVLPPKVRGAFS